MARGQSSLEQPSFASPGRSASSSFRYLPRYWEFHATGTTYFGQQNERLPTITAPVDYSASMAYAWHLTLLLYTDTWAWPFLACKATKRPLLELAHHTEQYSYFLFAKLWTSLY